MLPIHNSPHPNAETGTILFVDGFVLFSLSNATRAEGVVLGNGTLETFRRFTKFINFIELPINTPADKVREVYHNFTLHTLLSCNGIDMCPVRMTEENSLLSDRSLELVKLNRYARNFFAKVAGFFIQLKNQTI